MRSLRTSIIDPKNVAGLFMDAFTPGHEGKNRVPHTWAIAATTVKLGINEFS